MCETGNETMLTSEDQGRRIGEICGELWVRTYASRLEQNHLLAFVPEEVSQWNEWLQQPSQYTVTQRFFFVLAGDGNCDCDESQAFWQRYCEWALVDHVCFEGFVMEATGIASGLQNSRAVPTGVEGQFEIAHDIEKAQFCADAWEAGAHWAKHYARPEQLQALRVLTGNRQLPWRQRLASFSAYTVPELLYFALAGEVRKDTQASHSFWDQYCPAVFEHEECAKRFVCGAVNIEMPSLVPTKVINHSLEL